MRNLIIGVLIICTTQLLGNNRQIIEQILTEQTASKKYIDENPDSSLILLNEYKNTYLEKGDTLKAIRCLIETSGIYSNNANYSKSYDGFWEALILSDKIKDSTLIGEAYDGLGILYGLYHRNKLADDYFKKSIKLKKNLISKGLINDLELINTYYLLAIHYRVLQNYGLAQSYLDSCKFVANRNGSYEDRAYLMAEQAYLYYHNGELDKSEKLLLEVEKLFFETNKPYLVILYSFMGDLYFAMGETDKSEKYYLRSLEYSGKYKSHRNFVPEVYQKLSKLYINAPTQQNLKKAYSYLEVSKSLSDSLFGANSSNNASLLEIKDAFRVNQEKQQKLNESIQYKELEQEKRILFLRNIVLIISFASLLIISVIFFRNIKSRHRSEQIMLKNKQLINEQKNREILEIKNKELTSSALQLIEKDELLIDIKNQLTKYKTSDKHVDPDSILNRIRTNTKKDWKEFEARFTSVNETFYKTLSERFPNLTPGEQKLCALVKLNFSSKEMSQLLGISIESVHTSRYRLRKKLGLDKGENLTEFMSNLG